MGRGGWQAIVYGVAKHWTQLSDFHLYFPYVMFLTDLQSKLGRTDKMNSSVYNHKIKFPPKERDFISDQEPKASPKDPTFWDAK